MMVSELGSFTVAGDKLAKSQSSISLQIKKIEELIGQQVFIRQGHNFELTQAGETLLPYAKQILQLHDKVVDELLNNVIIGKVRLGIPNEFAVRLLPRVVGDFSRNNPQVNLEVINDLSCNLRSGLKQKKYDLILAILNNPYKEENVNIIEDELVWACAASEEFDFQKKPVSLVVAPEGCIYRKRAIENLQKAGIPWRITYTVMDIINITSAVEEGLGVTVLPRRTLPESLKEIPPPLGSERLGYIGLKLIHNQKYDASKLSLFLADYIKTEL